jgi:hypothetical protein
MTTGDEAAIAAAGAAAVAAVASWASVLQSARLQRRTLEPRLHIQVSEVMQRDAQNQIQVRVENTGGGFAQEVWFYVREGGAVCMSGLPPYGSLGPGQGVTIMTELVPVAPTRRLARLRTGRAGAGGGGPSGRRKATSRSPIASSRTRGP